MGVLAKRKKKYQIKSDAFINYAITCIKNTPDVEKRKFLTEYEQNAIRNPLHWAKHSPVEEIMVILTSLGYQFTIQAVDIRNPLRVAEFRRATKRAYERKQFDELIEVARTHNYFCMTGREIMKMQSFYSLFGDGTLFKVSKDASRFLKAAMVNDRRNQKMLDDVFFNVHQVKRVGELNQTDIHILYLIRKYEEIPMGVFAIHNALESSYSPIIIQKHVTKLCRYGYLQQYGLKRASMYTLTGKGWQKLTEIKKEYLKGIKFWDLAEPIEIYKPENENGTTSSPKGAKQHIA